ncbi:MAG TPA: hypothetical protein VKH64_10800 [Candidatus Binatia bacterium]|nr:hypothetical protein [Candidatus Binatia bacterium]
MARDLDLTFSLADYDRTRPILTGAVKADGINFQFRPAVPGEACLIPVYEQFDIAEMSLSQKFCGRVLNLEFPPG